MSIFLPEHDAINAQLHHLGFCKIPLLHSEPVTQLLSLYHRSPSPANPYFGFHVTLDLPEPGAVASVRKNIAAVIEPLLANWFRDFQLIAPRFAVKEPVANSLIPPHQDWSFVDESLHQSYNVWIALAPCDEAKGTLGFLPGSHRVLNNFRATPLPVFQVPFHHYAEQLTNQLQFVPLQAGDALVFNSRIIHGSRPNVSATARINIASELTDQSARLKHFYLSPLTNEIMEYDVDETFFSKYSNAKLTALYRQKQFPEGYPLVRTFKNEVKPITAAELRHQLKPWTA